MDGLGDGLLQGGTAVGIHLGGVFRAVAQAGRAADAAALTGHALDEVGVQQAFLGFEQGYPAGFDAVAHGGLEFKFRRVNMLFLQGLGYRCGQAAAAGKDAAEVGGVVQGFAGYGGQVDLPGREHGLHLFKGDGIIYILDGAGVLGLGFFCDARADKHHLAAGVGLLEPLGDLGHGGEGMGDPVLEGGEVLFHVADKGRAAGGEQKALFPQFLGLQPGGHIRAPSSLHHRVESQGMDACGHLFRGGAGILAGHGGGCHRINPVGGIVLGIQQQPDHLGDIGFIHDGPEGALVYAGAAGGAGLVMDHGLAGFLVDADGLGLAGPNTGASILHNGGIGAHAHALTAFYAFPLVDLGPVVHHGDGAFGAVIHTAVGQATPAGGGHLDAVHGALIAGDG